MAKKSRRDIADLLLKNRVETARLRVEGLIQDDIYVELLELLEVGLACGSGGSQTSLMKFPVTAGSVQRRNAKKTGLRRETTTTSPRAQLKIALRRTPLGPIQSSRPV